MMIALSFFLQNVICCMSSIVLPLQSLLLSGSILQAISTEYPDLNNRLFTYYVRAWHVY